MHGLISKISICYWQDQPDYYLPFQELVKFLKKRRLHPGRYKVYFQLKSEEINREHMIFASKSRKLRPWVSCTNSTCNQLISHDQLNISKGQKKFSHAWFWCRSTRTGVLQPEHADTCARVINIQYHSGIDTMTLV